MSAADAQGRRLLTVVIPVYRNAGSLKQTYVNLRSVLEDLADRYRYELIFVNDGSDDGSLDELLELRKIDRNVKIVDFVRNFGQVAAIQAGFAHAAGDAVVNISADLQDQATLIQDMVAKWEEGSKVVACSRAGREDDWLARVTSRVFYRLIKISIPTMPEGGFDYFLLDRAVYEELVRLDERNSFLQSDILWVGYRPHFIEYRRLKRPVGRSQWTLAKKLKYFIDGLINTSYLPIRLMSLLGVSIAVLGLAYAVVVVIVRLLHQTPFPGYAPIMIVLLVTSGLVMTMLGVIGEYVWRIYDEVRRRPRYIVRERFLE